MTGGVVSRAGWRLLTTELGRQRRAIVWLAAWSIVEAAPALLSGFTVAAALDQGFLAGQPMVGLGWLGLLGVAMLVRALATRATFPWLADIVEPVRDALVRIVVGAALRRAVDGDERADSAAVARLSGQTETVRNLVAALLRILRPTVISLAVALAGLLALAPAVAMITAALVVLSLLLFAWSMRVVAARQREQVLAEEAMAAVSTEVFDGLRDVVACGATRTAAATVDRAITAQARATVIMARASSSRAVIVALGADLPIVLILALAPWLRLTPGELVGAATYLVGTLAPALNSLTSTVASWGRQLGVLLHRIAETSAPPPPGVPAGGVQPGARDLVATGLTFAYGPNAEPVIDDLTLHIPAGDHLAVVGPSGVGKSTLASLLTGIAMARHGQVRLGGVPLGDVDRRAIALIPQQAYVFTASLRENLDYLRPQVTTAELDHAVTALGMRQLVDRLGGYDAPLGIGGPALSSGERQLIALARVFVSPATVVVLDEATCHLDPVAEARVEEAFAATGRTLIVIAHRISSARRARRILILDGTNVTIGSHDELLAASDRYANLVANWDLSPASADLRSTR